MDTDRELRNRLPCFCVRTLQRIHAFLTDPLYSSMEKPDQNHRHVPIELKLARKYFDAALSKMVFQVKYRCIYRDYSSHTVFHLFI